MGSVSPAEEPPQPTAAVINEDIATGEGEYEGVGARDSIHGYVYHLRLCILFLLRSLELKGEDDTFGLAAEHKKLNPFDDIVYIKKGCKGDERMYHLIQAKHTNKPDKKDIITKDLTKHKNNNWNEQFTLHKYLKGYCPIKKMPEFESARTNFIVCTNIDLDIDDLRNCGVTAKCQKNHPLEEVLKECKGKCYKLSAKEKSEFYKTLKLNSGAADEEVKMFLEDFTLAVGLPGGAELESIINKEIGNLFNFSITEVIGSELQKKMVEWLNNKKGNWMTRETCEKLMKEIEEEIVSLTCPALDISERLRERGIILTDEDLLETKNRMEDFIKTNSKEHFLQIIANPRHSILTAIKVQQVLELLTNDRFGYIFVRFNTLSYPKQKEYIQTVFSFRYTVNVLVVYCKVKDEILRHRRYLYSICKVCVDKIKRIILISEENVEIEDIEEAVSGLRATQEEDRGFAFVQLNTETQNRLFEREVVIFQGDEKRRSLSALIGTSEGNDVKTTKIKGLIDQDTMVALIRNEDIVIGNEVKDSLTLSKTYIERKLEQVEEEEKNFLNKISSTGYAAPFFRTSDIKKVTPDFRHFLYCYQDNEVGTNSITEDQLLNGNSKVAIITDEAGMGKTMLLNSLVKKVKRSDPNLWICRLNLINYTKTFKAEQEKWAEKQESVNYDINKAIDFFVDGLLMSQENTLLKTNFEKQLFKLAIDGHIKLMLFFDGFDEICPTYKEVVTWLLASLQKAKVEKLFVTTRPTEGRPLKEILGGPLLKTVPLTERQQINFLINHWGNALSLSGEGISRLERIWTIAKWQMDRTALKHPLTLVLLAEYWQDPISKVFAEAASVSGYLEYIVPAIESSIKGLSSNFDVVELSKYFVEKKFQVYQKEKSRDSKGNISSDNQFRHFINTIKKVHCHLGLIDVFGDHVAKELTTDELWIDEWVQVELPKIGVVQAMGGEYRFIHQAFAEYFALESIKNDPLTIRTFLSTDHWFHFIKSVHFSRRDYIRGYIVKGWFDKYVEMRGRRGKTTKDIADLVDRMKYVHTYVGLVGMVGQPATTELTGDDGPQVDECLKTELLEVGFLVEGQEKWAWGGMRFADMFFARPFIKDYVSRNQGRLDLVSNDFMKNRLLDGGVIDVQPEEYQRLKI